MVKKKNNKMRPTYGATSVANTRSVCRARRRYARDLLGGQLRRRRRTGRRSRTAVLVRSANGSRGKRRRRPRCSSLVPHPAWWVFATSSLSRKVHDDNNAAFNYRNDDRVAGTDVVDFYFQSARLADLGATRLNFAMFKPLST